VGVEEADAEEVGVAVAVDVAVVGDVEEEGEEDVVVVVVNDEASRFSLMKLSSMILSLSFFVLCSTCYSHIGCWCLGCMLFSDKIRNGKSSRVFSLRQQTEKATLRLA